MLSNTHAETVRKMLFFNLFLFQQALLCYSVWLQNSKQFFFFSGAYVTIIMQVTIAVVMLSSLRDSRRC